MTTQNWETHVGSAGSGPERILRNWKVGFPNIKPLIKARFPFQLIRISTVDDFWQNSLDVRHKQAVKHDPENDAKRERIDEGSKLY